MRKRAWLLLCLLVLAQGCVKSAPHVTESPENTVPVEPSETITWESAESEVEPVVEATTEPEQPPESTLDPPVQASTLLRQEIEHFLQEAGVSSDQISYMITNFATGEHVVHQPRREFVAASLYKLPLAMLYYDEIKAGRRHMDDLHYYEEWMVETDGPISEHYLPGDPIPLEYLLEMLIVASDNTAGHMLYTDFGGWHAMREAALKYTDQAALPQYYELENYMSAHYVNSVLTYLYQHQAEYPELLASMSQEFPESFLNSVMTYTTQQKTGYYEDYYSAAGLVLMDTPYAICVLTELGPQAAQQIIGDINYLAYTHFNASERPPESR